MRGVAAAYALSAATIAAVVSVIALSPAERSVAVVVRAAGTTSATVSGSGAPGADTGDDADNDGLRGAGDPCPQDARNACFGEPAVDAITGNPIRINAGAHPSLACARTWLDCNGEQWLADFGYRTPGALARCPEPSVLAADCPLTGIDGLFGCDGASTQQIFRCGRCSKTRRPVAYQFDVTAGTYLVNLYFAAGVPRSPDRSGTLGVTISLNGSRAYTRFDPADVTSETGEVVVRSALVEVGDGGLAIELTGTRKRTALRALEMLDRSRAQGRAGERNGKA
jgi:polyisoprenoid-binding protein YceI